MAPAVVVTISSELARDISRRFALDPPAVGGRSWGTEFLDDSYGPDPGNIDAGALSEPTQLFDLYLADIVLANGDRCNAGNLLLTPAGRRRRFDIIPIDQSEAFGAHETLRTRGRLWAQRDHLLAEMLPPAESAIVDAGLGHLDGAFERVESVAQDLRGAVNDAPAEWIDRGAIDADVAQEFIEHRAANIRNLANHGEWQEKCKLVAGSEDLFLDFES